MTSSESSPRLREFLPLGMATLVVLPWVVLRLAGFAGPPPAVMGLSGLAIVGSAFLLSWAGEVLQLYFSQSLAIILVALLAVLPEYAVEGVLAWKAGYLASYASYPTANLTGSNRLLIGLGWPLLFAVFAWRSRKPVLELPGTLRTELSMMLVATLYALVVAAKRALTLLDGGVFFCIFLVYLRRAAAAPRGEPHLEGQAEALARLPGKLRDWSIRTIFLAAGIVIFLSAEPFSRSMIEYGQSLHVEPFLLLQLLAPIASESPELIVGCIFTWKMLADVGLTTLISSKVNQWTVLVGMIPLAFAVSGLLSGRTAVGALPLDPRQCEELFLTAAQSLFAVALLSNFCIIWWEAAALVALYALQLVFNGTEVRVGFSFLYVVLALGIVLADARRRSLMVRMVGDIVWRR